MVDWGNLIKPVYIKLRLTTLLIILLILALLISCAVLYNNYVLHNWFFSGLSSATVEAVYVGDGFHPQTQLPDDAAQTVIQLLRSIRLREEPYTDAEFTGPGACYRIVLKSGIEFELMPYAGDPLMYVFGTNGYPVGSRNDPKSAAVYDHLRQLEILLEEYIETYCS